MQPTKGQRAAALPEGDFVQQVLLLAYGQGWTAPQPQRALALAQSRQVDSLALSLDVYKRQTQSRAGPGIAPIGTGPNLSAPWAPDRPAALH